MCNFVFDYHVHLFTIIIQVEEVFQEVIFVESLWKMNKCEQTVQTFHSLTEEYPCNSALPYSNSKILKYRHRVDGHNIFPFKKHVS